MPFCRHTYREVIHLGIFFVWFGFVSCSKSWQNDIAEWFRTLTGVMQDCIFSPQLFNILLKLVITLAIQDLNIGINLQGMTINNLRFTDVLIADSVEDRQTLVTNVHTVSRKFGLTINTGENRSTNNLQRKQAYVRLHWWVKTETSQDFHFKGVIADKSTCTDDITRRIGLAMGGIQKLTKIWN